MESPACPGWRERDRRIAELERRVAELEALVRDLTARLGANSTNSSVPPSANPLGAPKPVVKKKSKRKAGGQPGHPPRLKQLLPPERVRRVVTFVPRECEDCHSALPSAPSTDDPEPKRFQTAELPPPWRSSRNIKARAAGAALVAMSPTRPFRPTSART